MEAITAASSVSRILSVNCGSSSLKFGLYEASRVAIRLLIEGEAESLGTPNSQVWVEQEGLAEKKTEKVEMADAAAAFHHIIGILDGLKLGKLNGIGHRVVHGGKALRDHCIITEQVISEIANAVPFAPLHVPIALAVIKQSCERFPETCQVCCLDNAFHNTLPDVSRTLPLPLNLRDAGIERYGFHGLSVQSIIRQLSPLPERVIVAHLGSGSSITAVHKGKSIDNTMGLTPTGGIMMGSRPGDLDPGVIIYLLRHGFETPEKLELLLDRQSGLKGISGGENDMRELEKTRLSNPDADLAIRMFTHSVKKGIAAMTASLGGIDTLVFTGGIGEHAVSWRDALIKELTFLGSFTVKVLPAKEDETIASITAALCA